VYLALLDTLRVMVSFAMDQQRPWQEKAEADAGWVGSGQLSGSAFVANRSRH
jgi:hypothetical protein